MCLLSHIYVNRRTLRSDETGQLLEHAKLRREAESLRILTPTDCVRERLASAFYWQDSSALQAAVSVARGQAVDIRKIETWSQREAARFPGYHQVESLRRFLEALAR
jgi:hypothetical protein